MLSCLCRFSALLALLPLLLWPLAPSLAQEQDPTPGLYDRPVLVLDPDRHMAPIRRADVDRDGRFMVTGSHDKTVRVWSVKDGALDRTIRIPAGPGNVGRIYAVAIDPKGEMIAVGGWTGPNGEAKHIFLFDRASGTLVQRLKGVPDVIFHLTFSPDGRYLAAVIGAGHGLRIYDRALDWAEIAQDDTYGDSSLGAAFANDGRLATTSLDGQIRLYTATGFSLIKKQEAPGREHPFSLAFSPDGQRLAVGFQDGTAVTLLDGYDLSVLPSPDTSGIDNGVTPIIAWSSDGSKLHAAGNYQRDGLTPVVSWSEDGTGTRSEWSYTKNSVMSLLPLADNGLVVAAQDPYLGRLNANGQALWQHPSPKADFRGQRQSISVSDDGTLVGFGYQEWGETPAKFDLQSLSLTSGSIDDGATQEPIHEGLNVVDWANSDTPMLDGKHLPLKRFERSRSLAIHPGRSKFVLGTEWHLRAFDRSGDQLWQHVAPSTAWAVNISGDGRLVVAAYGDGTIRWHDIEDGKELLAFLPLADQERWVAWTPEGYYASSAVEGTGELLGWHVNRGWDQPADFFPISAIKGFHQPDVLPLALQERDTARALGLAKIDHDRKRVQELVKSAAPPGAQLHVLTVGVSDYAYHDHLKLDFADDDATDIANALMRQEGSLYAKVNMQHLVNDQATRAGVYQALNTIRIGMQPDQEDVAVIHFSGHGAEIDGNYYLLPHDVQANDNLEISVSGIEVERLKHFLSKMGEHGKVLVLLDACHSGNVSPGGRSTLPDVEKIRDELAAAGNGVIVLTSSTGKEISVENPDWKNGAFTEAVLEALEGKADHDGDRWLTVAELQGYVVDRVRDLTDNRQNPRVSSPSGTQFQSRLFVLTE